MIDIVIDTNAFVSKLDSQDKWNSKTNDILNKLASYSEVNIIVLDIVVNESINVLCKRFESKGKQDEFPSLIDKIGRDFNDKIVWISEFIKSHHENIMELLKNHKGNLNYNDCFIISYMKNARIKYIISFDEDFDLVENITRISSAEIEL